MRMAFLLGILIHAFVCFMALLFVEALAQPLAGLW